MSALRDSLPEDLRADFDRLLGNDDLSVQSFFRIFNLRGELVPFVYNRAQRLHQSRGTIFDVVLKARKEGISSRRFALDLWRCATRTREHRILLTHTDAAAEKLLREKIVPLIDNCRVPLGAKVTLSAGRVEFPDTGSVYYVGTAGTRKFGRGDDVTGFHFSEYAQWAHPEAAAGVEEALTENADGLIETTANGHNFFKVDWDRAKRGEGRYRAIFLPWYCHEDYSLDAKNLGPISEKERTLMEAFSLTPEQLAWRRWKISTMRDPGLFPQEYPETDEEAFLSGGRPVFDPLALLRLRSRVEPCRYRGHLVRQEARVILVDHPQGSLRIWKSPEAGHVYSIGADVAEGVQGGAYSSGVVLDVGDSEQVAEWHGHVAPDLFADDLELLAAWYRHAIVVPEAWPGPGEVTTSHLKGRVNLWRAAGSDAPGWSTTAESKPRMIHALHAALRDRNLVLRSPELLAELHAFCYSPKGAMGPSAGNFSDRVMALAIVWSASRDLASRTDYYRAQGIGSSLHALGRGVQTSVPKWNGPRLGVREA